MKSLFTLLMSHLLIVACEARVLDPDGSTIKQPTPIQSEARPDKVVTIKDLNVKGVIPYVDMESGKVTYNKNELEGHDFSIEVDFSVFQVFVKLGEDYTRGTQAQAFNSLVKDFHAITTAPANGYLQDSDNGGLIIGNQFYDGGNGWSGFHMTKNVYFVKTRNGMFAKLQFLKAKQGNVDLQYFVQSDGSHDLSTMNER